MGTPAALGTTAEECVHTVSIHLEAINAVPTQQFINNEQLLSDLIFTLSSHLQQRQQRARLHYPVRAPADGPPQTTYASAGALEKERSDI